MSTQTEMLTDEIDISGAMRSAYKKILTPEAIQFVAWLHRKFNTRRLELLQRREERLQAIKKGEFPDFLPQTASLRQAEWTVNAIPADLQNRRTEITGPVDRRMVINALNSGANVFMADFEDASSPTWSNVIEGQINLYDALRRQIDFTAENGKTYRLNEATATLVVRPRGWHLVEKHWLIDGQPASASLVDFGLYFFHNARQLLKNGSGPYFYLPKLENHLEARLWNEVFVAAQERLKLPLGTIKVTVLIETILAAFEMDEIIYELRHHLAGLNAGRWDYIFSIIKKFKDFPEFILPDRTQVTMRMPFMRAYCRLLVQTCHKRGAHAIGGMSAFIPSRRDAEVNKIAFERVKADKELEAETGFDGTWVAHPDLVPVAKEPFDKVLGNHPHQKHVKRENDRIEAGTLINVFLEEGTITEEGLRANINIGILYIASWLRGVGAAAIHNLMEDAATAEISRAQVWQWLHHQVKTYDGRPITLQWYKNIFADEVNKIKEEVGENGFVSDKYEAAAALFDKLVTQPQFEAFLTLSAYELLTD
ncbi:MAG: malate synthase A [Spirosomataceae bacterium]